MGTSFDFGQTIRAATLIPAQAWNGDAAITSEALDLSGSEGVALLVQTGTVAAGADIGVAFHEGDADDFTPGSGNEIAAGNIQSAPTIDDTNDTAYVFALRPTKRYVKIVVSRDGTDAAALSATGILGFLDEIPA